MRTPLLLCTFLLHASRILLINSFILVHHDTKIAEIRRYARKEATFGMGCFWKPAEELLRVDGVLETVAGYTGKADAIKAPTYETVCYSRDWVEGVRVAFDDDKLTYVELLDAFFNAQEPQPQSRQYSSIIFPHDEQQMQVAQSWLEKEKRRGDGISTRITKVEPLTRFFEAEGYHQRYWQKQRPRFAAIFVLLLLSTGIADTYIPTDMTSALHTVCNFSTIALGLYQIAERKLDSKVVEL